MSEEGDKQIRKNYGNLPEHSTILQGNKDPVGDPPIEINCCNE